MPTLPTPRIHPQAPRVRTLDEIEHQAAIREIQEAGRIERERKTAELRERQMTEEYWADLMNRGGRR